MAVIEGIETRFENGLWRIASPDIEKPRNLTPPEKIALERKNYFLSEKAASRQSVCWSCGCLRVPIVWVHEVSFDFKGPKATPVQHAAVSSSDYPGPVPGLCFSHLGHGPAMLAEAVYFDRPEIAWGVRPTRWFVVFTDGTRQGGDCLEIDPHQRMPELVTEHLSYGFQAHKERHDNED